VARTSAFQFKGKSGDVQQIGRALRAEYLIEGSVRKDQNGFRVNARLVDAGTGYRLWSHAYYGLLDDLFGIPTAIANGIATALSGQHAVLEATPKIQGHAPEAHQFYLRARFHRNQWTLEGFEKSVDYFQRALRVCPNSAQILAALSEAEINRSLLSGLVSNVTEVERARSYAQQALAMDDKCPQAHLSLGWIFQLYDWQWESAEAEFDQALVLNPSFAEAWHLKGIALAVQRRVSEAEESLRRAVELDPLSRVIQSHTALVPYFSDDLEEAESRITAALSLDARFAEPHWILGLIQERQGKYSQAIEELRLAIQLGGENPVILGDIAFVYTLLGDFQNARRIVAQLETGFPRPHPAASNLARVYLGLGEPETSNAWLEEAFAARDFMLPWACVDRRYENMWSLPGFSALRERILGATPIR
jgi:tetratricopeptide (TPR) repeat protein